MKSPHTPEGQKWDHIGFILNDGRLRDMSGHRGLDKAPKTYNYDHSRENTQQCTNTQQMRNSTMH